MLVSGYDIPVDGVVAVPDPSAWIQRLLSGDLADFVPFMEQYFDVVWTGIHTFLQRYERFDIPLPGAAEIGLFVTGGVRAAVLAGLRHFHRTQPDLVFSYLVPAAGTVAAIFMSNYAGESWPHANSPVRFYDCLQPLVDLLQCRDACAAPPRPQFVFDASRCYLRLLLPFGSQDALDEALFAPKTDPAARYRDFRAAVVHIVVECGVFLLIPTLLLMRPLDSDLPAALLELAAPHLLPPYRQRFLRRVQSRGDRHFSRDPRFRTPAGFRLLRAFAGMALGTDREQFYAGQYAECLAAALANPQDCAAFVQEIRALAKAALPRSLANRLQGVFERVLALLPEAPDLVQPALWIAGVLVEHAHLTLPGLFGKVRENLACLAAFFARFAVAVPQDALVAAASRFAVTTESAQLYVQVCATFPALPAVPDFVLQLLKLNDREVEKAVMDWLVPIAGLHRAILDAIVCIDKEGCDYDLLLFAAILGALGVEQIRLTQAENRLLYGLTADEMMSCFEHRPFLVIPNLVLLWEFAPRDARLYRLLEARCLDAIATVTDQLLMVNDTCDEFISLLVAAFEATQNRQFLWKALDTCEFPSERLHQTVRPLLVNENKMELLAALAKKPRFLLSNFLRVGISEISFDGFDASPDISADALGFLLLCGCTLGVDLAARVFKGSSSERSREVAFKILSANFYQFDDSWRETLAFACQKGSVSLVKKLLSLPDLDFDEAIWLTCFSEAHENHEILTLLLNSAGELEDEVFSTILSADNLAFFKDRLSFEARCQFLLSDASSATLSAFFSSIESETFDHESFEYLWNLFFSGRLPPSLRTPNAIGRFFRLVAQYPSFFAEFALTAETRDYSPIRPKTTCVFVPALASLDSLLRSETGELRGLLFSFRFSVVKALFVSPEWETFDFDDILPLLSGASVDQLLFLLELDGEISSYPSLPLSASRTVGDALARFLSVVTILKPPTILVLEFNSVTSTNLEVNYILIVGNDKYQLRSVICSPNIVFIYDRPRYIRCDGRACSFESHISGALSYLFYESVSVPPIDPELSSEGASPATSQISRALFCDAIDWNAFSPTPAFLKTAHYLISTFHLAKLLDSLQDNTDFSALFFADCLRPLNEPGFATGFAAQLERLIAAHPDHVQLLTSVVEQGAYAVKEVSIYAEAAVSIFLSPSITDDELLVTHSLICCDSRYRRAPNFSHFLSHLLFERPLDLLNFFEDDDADIRELLRIAVRLSDSRLKPFILPMRTAHIDLIVKNASNDYLRELLFEDRANAEFALACAFVMPTAEMLAHVSAFRDHPEIRSSARWLRDFLESSSAELRHSAAEFLLTVWPPSSPPQDTVSELLRDLVIHPHILWHYKLLDAYATWLPQRAVFADSTLAALWSITTRPSTFPEYTELLSLILKLPAPTQNGFWNAFADGAEITIGFNPQDTRSRPPVKRFTIADRRLFATAALRIFARFPDLIPRDMGPTHPTPRILFRLLLSTDATREELDAIACDILDNITEENFARRRHLLRLFEFAPFLLVSRLDQLFAFTAFKDSHFLLSFSPFIFKLVADEFNTRPRGCATAEAVRETPIALLTAWNALLKQAPRLPDHTNQRDADSVVCAIGEVQLIWYRDPSWLSAVDPQAVIAWLECLMLSARLWPRFHAAMQEFFGRSPMELFAAEHPQVRAAHTAFILKVARATYDPQWQSYLCRALASQLAHRDGFDAVRAAVSYFTEILTRQPPALVEQLTQTPELFLLAEALAGEADADLAEWFFVALFAAGDGRRFALRDVPGVIAGARASEHGKLRLLRLWADALGPQMQPAVAPAVDDFERMAGAAAPAAPLSEAFDALILALRSFD
jgi:hypothetical protein